MQAVLSARLAPAGLKLTALALADWCNDSGGSLYPSMARIAERVGVSRSQAQRHVHALVQAGVLSVVGNPNGGKPGSTPRYQLHIDRLRLLHTDSAGATGSTHATRRTDAVEGAHGCTGGVAPTRQTGSTDATQSTNNHQITVKEPSITRVPRFDAVASLSVRGVDESLAREWIAFRKGRRATVTANVIDAIASEAAKAGWSMANALTESMQRGWTGFKAEWVAQAVKRAAQSIEPAWRREQSDRMAQFAPGVAAKRPNSQPDYIDVEASNAAGRLD
jgi:hypothetical protein